MGVGWSGETRGNAENHKWGWGGVGRQGLTQITTSGVGWSGVTRANADNHKWGGVEWGDKGYHR